MASVILSNRAFRRALLSAAGLAAPTPGDGLPAPVASRGVPWALDTVRRLGFVQVDPISAVGRAHHHILHARNPAYRPADLEQLLERDRELFENWTHDAAILPIGAGGKDSLFTQSGAHLVADAFGYFLG